MKTNSLVFELQALATNNSTDITELLRKALLVATKLKITDFRDWVNKELHGYDDMESIPDYRIVTANLYAKNPYHGLVPLLIYDNPELMKALSHIPIQQDIGGLADLLKGNDAELMIPFAPQQLQALIKMQRSLAPLPPVRTVGRNQVASILDAVRTAILDWSLELENQGILGEGMTFTNEEKQKAMSNQNVHIQNFQGVLGNVNQSTLNQDLDMTITAGDFNSLSRHLSDVGVGQGDLEELRKALAADPPKPESRDKLGPKVAQWMGKMMTKAAEGSWKIAVGAAGTVLGKALLAYYGMS